MDAVETIERDGFKVEVFADEDPMSPKDWDRFGELVAFSPLWREFTFAERESTSEEDNAYERGGFPLLARYLRLTQGAEIVGFRFDDHGAAGARLYEEYDGSGAGFIVADGAKIKQEMGADASRALARGLLVSELEEWGQYVAQEVYGYVITGPQGEHLDSLWGMYGFDYCKEEADAALTSEIAYQREEDLKVSRSVAL